MSTLRTFYPEIEPYDSGMLDVGDGHQIYWEKVGTPGAKPSVFLHGGATSPHHTSHAGAQCRPLSAMSCWRRDWREGLNDHNRADQTAAHRTTQDQTPGGGWRYNPELVVRGVYTVTKPELDWYYQFGVSEMFPDRWETFTAPIPEAEHGDMMAAYRKRLTGDDEAVKMACAKAWSQWEGATITLLPDDEQISDFGGDKYALAFARIENHYFTHLGWLEDGQILRDATKLKGIPGVIVHGRYDMPCRRRSH